MTRRILAKLGQASLTMAMLSVLGAVLLVGAASLPVLFGFTSYIVRSGSMEPAIPVGASVVGQVVDPAEIREGDIITYYANRAQDLVVTHRVVSIDRSDGGFHLRTQGDANNAEDLGEVDATRPIARVVYSVPFAGYLLAYLGSPAARLMLLGGGAVLLWLRMHTGSGSKEEARVRSQ